MSGVSAYERKKEPEKVRRALLDAIAQLSVEHGLANVTLDSVAKAAGVTKGGLFHHFQSKHALIHGMFQDLLMHFDAVVDAAMAADPEPHGRFTRAYLAGAFADQHPSHPTPFAGICVSMLADHGLQQMWQQWLVDRLERHADTDGDAMCEIVRLATDGIWIAAITPTAVSPVDFDRARATMLRLTKRIS